MQVSSKYRWIGYNDVAVFVLLLSLLLCAARESDSKDCTYTVNSKTFGDSCDFEKPVFSLPGRSVAVICSELWSKDLIYSHRHVRSALEIRVNDRLVDDEQVEIIDSSTIAINLETLPPSKYTFNCRLKKHYGIGNEQYEVLRHNDIFIGDRPQKPNNFKCVSQNWQNLLCTWEPVPNYVPTQFFLSASVRGSSLIACPIPRDQDNTPPNSCLWDATTNPAYRPDVEHYTFTLDAENGLGRDSFIYRFHNWAHVIPSRPDNLSIVEETVTSALLFWKVPHSMMRFPPGLHHRIIYYLLLGKDGTSRRFPFQPIYITNLIHDTEIRYNLTNLEYISANPYNIRVCSKSSIAVGEEMWSQCSDITFIPQAKQKNEGAHSESNELETQPSNAILDCKSVPCLKNMLTAIEQSVADVKEVKKSKMEYTSVVDRKLNEMKEFNDKIDSIISAMKVEIESLSKDNGQLREFNSKMNLTISTMKDEIKSLSEDNRQLREFNSENNSTIYAMKLEIDSLLKDNRQRQEVDSKIESTVSAIKVEIVSLSEENRQLRDINSNNNSTISTMKLKIDSLSEDSRKLQDFNSARQYTISAMKLDIDSLEMVNRHLCDAGIKGINLLASGTKDPPAVTPVCSNLWPLIDLR